MCIRDRFTDIENWEASSRKQSDEEGDTILDFLHKLSLIHIFKDAAKARRRIDAGRVAFGVYLVTLSENPGNLLEIVPSYMLKMCIRDRCQCADLLCLGYSWCICDQNRKWALHVLVWHAPRSYKQNYHTGFAGGSGSGCYCHTDYPFWAQQES